jgi:hypothetical protein
MEYGGWAGRNGWQRAHLEGQNERIQAC